MNPLNPILGALAGLVLALSPAGATADCPPHGTFVIGPLKIVDVEDGEVRPGRALRIVAGQIAEERDWHDELPSEMAMPWIDGAGLFAIPGLIDAHVHAVWAADVPEAFFADFLDHGVTAIRDMGGDLAVLADTRQRLESCELAGPRLMASGPFLDGSNPVDPGLSIAIADETEARGAVRQLAEAGVDFLKIYSLLPEAALASVLDEANAMGLAVAGHLPAGVPPDSALAFRFQTIEHMAIETGGLCAGAAGSDCLNLLARYAVNDVALTPTIGVRQTSTDMARTGFAPPATVFPPIVADYWEGQRQAAVSRAGPDWFARRQASLDEIDQLTLAFQQAGGVLLAGSDTGNPFIAPGVSLHEELRHLVEAGLTPREALAAATSNAGRLFEPVRIGRLEPGYRADIVLLESNPLENISATQEIRAVYVNGVRVDD